MIMMLFLGQRLPKRFRQLILTVLRLLFVTCFANKSRMGHPIKLNLVIKCSWMHSLQGETDEKNFRTGVFSSEMKGGAIFRRFQAKIRP